MILVVVQCYFSCHYKMAVFYIAVERRGKQAAGCFHSCAGVPPSCCALFGSRSDFPETLFFVNIFTIWTDLQRTTTSNLASKKRRDLRFQGLRYSRGKAGDNCSNRYVFDALSIVQGKQCLALCLLLSITVNQMCMKTNELFFKQVLNQELVL